MEVTANWLDAESVKPRPGRIVCVKDRDGPIGYGWTIRKLTKDGEEELEWKQPDTRWFGYCVSASELLRMTRREACDAEPLCWISLYELKQKAAWRKVVPDAYHYIGVETECSEQIIAWPAGLEGMPPKGAQVLVRLGAFGNFRWYGTRVTRLAKVEYSDWEGYKGCLTFVLEEPSDWNFDFSGSVKEWAWLPRETPD